MAWQAPHRFRIEDREAFDDGWDGLTLTAAGQADAGQPTTQVIWEEARSAITRNDSPDIGFALGLNPYRGCEHVMWRQKLLPTGSKRGPISRVFKPAVSSLRRGGTAACGCGISQPDFGKTAVLCVRY